MSQLTTGGTDFSLPDEILAVIPMDPYDQLDLARKITSMAIASRVSYLESERGRMKQRMFDKDRVIFELQEKLGHLQRVCQESESKLRLALDENVSRGGLHKGLSERKFVTFFVVGFWILYIYIYISNGSLKKNGVFCLI